jgi:3-deoxy-D-manno-octulosonate 8-phosphate phosphatase (KDO 8-P phosphatase)
MSSNISGIISGSIDPELPPEIRQRAAGIRLLLMDVDGVLTDGVIYNIPGTPDVNQKTATYETKGFNSQDGIALQWLMKSGVQTGVVSGRISQATEIRARQLDMTYVYLGRLEKLPILDEIIARSGLSLAHIAYAGDDLVDIPVMRRVGLAFAPANARLEVKKFAHCVTPSAGGQGAVREMVEILMQANGTWGEILKKYEVE